MPAAEADRPGKVFVGGLASDIDEAVLEKYFSHYGRLTEVIVKRDKNTQQTRGYAFITFENPYDAEDAIKEMDKKEIHGRQIYVEQAVKPRHETQNLRPPPRGGGFRGAPRGSRGGGRGGGGSRGGPRGRMGDGHMDRSRSPIRQRPDRGRPDRDFSRSDRGGRDGFDGPQRRDLIDEFEHRQMLDEEKPWITPELLVLVRQKDEMQEWANKCPSLVAEYRKFRNHVRMKVRKAKIQYEDPTGEKREAEFNMRMLKKGLTPEEIEKRKAAPRPETHHGGKKYTPPVIYPGNLSGAASMKLNDASETVSVTRDPEVFQQKSKFVNLLSKQSKTVYESFQNTHVTQSNWSEDQDEGFSQGYGGGDKAPNPQLPSASFSKVPNSNFVQPVGYPQTQGYSQGNAKFNLQIPPPGWSTNVNKQNQVVTSGIYQGYATASYASTTTNTDSSKAFNQSSSETTPNPWAQAMSDYWDQSAQASSFGKFQGASFASTNASQIQPSASFTQSSVNQMQPFASQTMSSPYQHYTNLPTQSSAQQTAGQTYPNSLQSQKTESQSKADVQSSEHPKQILNRLSQMAYGAQSLGHQESTEVPIKTAIKQTSTQIPQKPKQQASSAKLSKLIKPPVQYFKGVAKNKNKIQIKINQNTLGIEAQAKKDIDAASTKVTTEVTSTKITTEVKITKIATEVIENQEEENENQEEEIDDGISGSNDKENPWQQAIEDFWKNLSQGTSSVDPNQGDNAKNDKEDKNKLEDNSMNITLPKEPKTSTINQSLIESQKNVLAKVISSKTLKDKNWSESQEACDKDIEQLDLNVDNSHYYPHPATVSPPRDLNMGDNDGMSLNAPNPGSCDQDFGGDRYGGMDRGAPPRSRDPPMSRGRDYSPSSRDFGRGSAPDRMSRGSARDFQSSRYDPPPRDFSPPPRDFHSSRDMIIERGPTSRDRMSTRDYGSPQNTRDFGGSMSRGGSSMYAGSRDQGMGSREVYVGGRDRDLPSSRDYMTSREFSSRGGSSRGGLSRGGGEFDRGQPLDDSYRDSGRGGPLSRGPPSRGFSSMGSQRDSGRPSHDMYESSNRGQSRGGPPSNRGPPSRGPPPRGVPSRGPPPRDDRDRGGYSTGQRRPSNMDSRGGGPPMKRARPSGMSSRGSMRR